MEDNQCVIMDRYPRNQLIVRTHMTSNKMLPLTLKPSKKKNATPVFGKEKDVQLNIAFTAKSVRNSNKENSEHGINKEESGAKMKEAFQYKVYDDSWL
jgi:hypothetical protein